MTEARAGRPEAEQPGSPASAPIDAAGVGTGALQLVNLVLRHAFLVFGLGFGLLLVVGVHSLFRPRTYTTTASFILAQPTSDRNALAGIAAQFGITPGATGQMESPQFYADLLRSPETLRGVVLQSYSVPTDSGPVTARLDRIWGIEGNSEEEIVVRTVRALDENLTVQANPRTGAVSFGVTTVWPQLSSALVSNLLDALNAFNLATRQSNAASERRFVESRLAVSRQELADAEAEHQAFLQRNRQFDSPQLRFEQDRHARNVAMRQQIVTSLASSFEQARIDEVRNTPLITVVEKPRPAPLPNARGTVRRAGLAGVLGAILGLLLAVGLDWLRRARREGNPELAELVDRGESVIQLRWRRRSS